MYMYTYMYIRRSVLMYLDGHESILISSYSDHILVQNYIYTLYVHVYIHVHTLKCSDVPRWTQPNTDFLI